MKTLVLEILVREIPDLKAPDLETRVPKTIALEKRSPVRCAAFACLKL